MSLNEILHYKFETNNFQYLNNLLSSRLRSRDFKNEFNEQLGLLLEELKEKEKKGEINKEDFESIYIEQSTELIAYLSIYDYPYIMEDQNDEDNDDYNYIHSNFRKEIVEQFCNEYNHLLSKKIKTKEGIFTIEDFYQQTITVKKDKELISLYFVLVNDSTGDKKYIKVKTIIDIFINAIKQLQESTTTEVQE